MAKRRTYKRDRRGRFASIGALLKRATGGRPLTPIGQARTPAVKAERRRRGAKDATATRNYLTEGGRKLTPSDQKLIKRIQRG